MSRVSLVDCYAGSNLVKRGTTVKRGYDSITIRSLLHPKTVNLPSHRWNAENILLGTSKKPRKESWWSKDHEDYRDEVKPNIIQVDENQNKIVHIPRFISCGFINRFAKDALGEARRLGLHLEKYEQLGYIREYTYKKQWEKMHQQTLSLNVSRQKRKVRGKQLDSIKEEVETVEEEGDYLPPTIKTTEDEVTFAHDDEAADKDELHDLADEIKSQDSVSLFSVDSKEGSDIASNNDYQDADTAASGHLVFKAAVVVKKAESFEKNLASTLDGPYWKVTKNGRCQRIRRSTVFFNPCEPHNSAGKSVARS